MGALSDPTSLPQLRERLTQTRVLLQLGTLLRLFVVDRLFCGEKTARRASFVLQPAGGPCQLFQGLAMGGFFLVEVLRVAERRTGHLLHRGLM